MNGFDKPRNPLMMTAKQSQALHWTKKPWLSRLVRHQIALVSFIVLAACGQSQAPWSPTAEQIARNNEGVALMGQYQNEPARQVFADLLASAPEWVDVEVNLAIATLNRQQEDDELRALEIVERVLETHPDHLRARYIAGLMRFYIGQSEQALIHFERLRSTVDDDAHVAYFTAQTLGQLGEHERALALYLRAIELDPYLRSAYYGAALTLRTLGRADEARAQLITYQKFANNPRAHLAEFRYTRKGVLAEALAIGERAPSESLSALDGALFLEAERLDGVALETIASMTTADLNGDGWQDLFVAGGAGQPNEVWLGHAGGWVRQAHPLDTVSSVMAAAFGDINNDGILEVYLCRAGPNQLLTAGQGQPVAGSMDVADPGQCEDVAMVDADHDGDLDLVIINQVGGLEILNNNLNGTFRALSEAPESNFLPKARSGRQILMTDMDGDRVLDVIALDQSGALEAWRNDRLWQYQPLNNSSLTTSEDILHLASGDLEADGQPNVVSLHSNGAIVLWQDLMNGQVEGRTIGQLDGDIDRDRVSSGLSLVDFDGDGRLDVLVHSSNGFAVYRYLATDHSLSVMYQSQAPIKALLPVVHNISHGPSVVAVVSSAAQALTLSWWRAGEGRYAFVGIDPTGRSSKADGMRSNASGIGTQVVARTGQHWTILDRVDDSSGPGQSLQPMILGVGDAAFADFIKLYWSDGVLQTEMALASGQVHTIEEFQRQLASCPVIFAWNGERFDFVSDILGVGGIGFFQAPGQYAEPRPWEYFRFPEGTAESRDGRYPIKITEPMQEIAYIDATWLHVYDLPKEWSVAMDERMHTGGGPAPQGTPIFYRPNETLWPVMAYDQNQREVVDALRVSDGLAADPGPRDTRFLGRLATPQVLELDFGQVINRPGTRPVFWASGWVEYPYSQTVFAAWQAEADYAAPSLSAYADGQWHLVHEAFGYPAGMPREMTMTLDALPPNTTKLRIEGNWEVYWDAIGVINARPAPPQAKVHRLSPVEAVLSKTGFARRDTLAQRRPYYDYQDRQPYWDTHYQSGFYTRLGPVMELVSTHNNAFAIIGPGEELHLEFDAPPKAQGTHRVVVLETRGYAKDKDLYTRDGATVGPLPFAPEVGGLDEREALHAEYMTRYQGGF